MTNKIEISPEIARLAQIRSKAVNLSFSRQMARCIAEQAILSLDPELDFLLDGESSLAEVDAIARVVDVNDIVVNSRHIDIALLENGNVRLPVALVNTAYGKCGSLIVQMFDTTSGAVIGHVDAGTWIAASEVDANAQFIVLPFVPASFDLARCLQRVEAEVPVSSGSPGKQEAKTEDYVNFLRNRQAMPLERQRQVIDAAITSQSVRENLTAISGVVPDQLPRVLRQSGVWEARIDLIVARLTEKFKAVKPAEIEAVVRSVGEKFGGQPEASHFKQELIKSLAKQELKLKFTPELRAAADAIIDRVAAGKRSVDAVKDFVKNQVAVEIAAMIKEARKDVHNFAQASAEEFGFAFQKLALQPAYATHSQSETSGVDDVNEALILMEAGQLMEELNEIEL